MEDIHYDQENIIHFHVFFLTLSGTKDRAELYIDSGCFTTLQDNKDFEKPFPLIFWPGINDVELETFNNKLANSLNHKNINIVHVYLRSMPFSLVKLITYSTMREYLGSR